MRIACGYCRNLFAKLRLHRVGHRLLCRKCFTALKRGGKGEPGPGTALQLTEMKALQRLTAGLAYSGLVAKALVFFLFFLWARQSSTGAAALRGAVAADVFTWVAFSLMEWQFRRFQVTVGALFEILLVILYVNRGAWFGVTTDAVAASLSFLWFLLFATLKGGVLAAELTLEVTGVKEPAST